MLEQASDNILAAATAHITGQKETIEALVATIKAENQAVLSQAHQLLRIEEPSADVSTKLGELPITESREPVQPLSESISSISESVHQPTNIPSAKQHTTPLTSSSDTNPEGVGQQGDWADQVQQHATIVVHRLRIRDGSTGWPFEKIFPARFLQGALRVRLVDPYLANPHQIRNLNEFLLHLAETAHPKEIEVMTGYAPLERAEHQERTFDNAAKDLFKNYGVVLTLIRETTLHDRFLILDHGVLFKLGRGLDIYKPAVGLAEHRSANRKGRETEVDVFCQPGHVLTEEGRGS